jgi:hypothetical protein
MIGNLGYGQQQPLSQCAENNMIRMMSLINLKPLAEELSDKQKKLDVDKDGEIEGSDLAKLRAKNETRGGDHEVSMANNLLDDIMKNVVELKMKMGQGEKDVPAWIQDHISQAQNFIAQANTNFHEYETPAQDVSPEPMAEKAPEGWEGTVKAMKDEPEIDNPFALANWMKSKGYKSHKGK